MPRFCIEETEVEDTTLGEVYKWASRWAKDHDMDADKFPLKVLFNDELGRRKTACSACISFSDGKPEIQLEAIYA